MVHVELKDLYRIRYSLLWSVLSFKAGLLNSAGFLILGSYISHVTGFGTQVGIAIGHKDYPVSFELLIIPVTFILGSFIVSLILDRNYSPTQTPNYHIVQLLITSFLGIISLYFSLEKSLNTNFLAMGTEQVSYILIGILCFICGMKNGLTTWASHGKIRTTHLTGLSTDIGLHLLKTLSPEGRNSRYPESKRANYMRILTILSFSFGACLSAILVPHIGYKVFHLAFFISICLSIVSIIHRYKLNKLNYNNHFKKLNQEKICEP